ncbi:programmed cell death 6-interacting protein-like isoform X3 [Lineus longissimus]|uniref:programmed cell death 6-interacting protein-like isoform X3 n=1 Tax=Lineus longissimus TaxID=88925 RepID=UPI00315CF049
MATLLAIPLKTTNEVDLIKPLQKFITNTFEQLKAEDVSQALNDFNRQRNHVISKMVDRHESALEVLFKYYDQLCAIESKLPIAENQIRVEFKWTDAFATKGVFGGRKSLSMSSGAYEKVCVLYQIAAVQSQIAEAQNHDTDDGLKTSAKYYQQSSGIFEHLKDCVASIVPHPTMDLNRDTISALSALMLAQAQDCFFRKARKDHMKDAIIAKVAHQVSHLYQTAFQLLSMTSISQIWPKDWLAHVQGRVYAFHALAEYHQSVVAGAGASYGEQIARLKQANDLMNTAKSKAGQTFKFTNEDQAMKAALVAAEKDNNYIYHDKIPAFKTLTPVGKAVIAKSLPLSTPMSSDFRDHFEKIVPLAVHQASTIFENRRGELVNFEIGRLREATQLMNSVNASMNLPAAIEDLSGTQVPASVLEKSVKIKELGGVQTIETLMQELPELLGRNREILDECIRLLDDEQSSDDELRAKFKDQWTRAKSIDLTRPIRDEGQKYRSILDAAVQADHIVKDKFGKTRNGIVILGKNPRDLEASIPSASPVAALKDSPVVQTLRKLMDSVDALKAERDAIEHELKDKTFDMAGKFMSALSADGVVDQEVISEQELDRVYSPLRAQVQDSVHRQEALLAQIQQANNDFCQAKQSSGGATNRETILKDLAESYDAYCELKGNLEEGTKFYNDLTQLLLRYQNKIKDFCFARKTEKDDLMKDVQSAIANRPTDPPPTQPSYQQPPAKAMPPARPPPPKTQANAPQAPSQAPPQNSQAPQGYGARPSAPEGYGAPAYQPYPYPTYTPPAMPSGYAPYGQYGQQTPQPGYGAPPGYGGYQQQPPQQNYGQQPPYQQQPYQQHPSAPYQQQWR